MWNLEFSYLYLHDMNRAGGGMVFLRKIGMLSPESVEQAKQQCPLQCFCLEILFFFFKISFFLFLPKAPQYIVVYL